ncbi:putative exported protein [Halobacteriovorax marinus SJ]|uniref:Exported protein n=1 Tax=Halobacteriovorax marinus (strain ATCC BAA-682 / DSM 15412 / SJ) TaxID=862908 RepID=E1X0G9_HALMS|nr:hypothetical protein [Halobacteriovorax marinus]CBW27995.1 putative exported protein [Halobacteriovorax marinus SJ]
MSKLKAILLFLALIGSTFAGGIDISKEYLLAKTQIQSSSFNRELLISFLRSQTVLLVPGVLSESFNSNSNQRIKVNYALGEIFSDHEEWLMEYGINYEFLDIESESSPSENKDFIIQVLEEIPNNIILFTHSKGGLDTFAALSSRPDLLEKITGVITVQTPFNGSPVADAFAGNSITRSMGKWLFQFLGGSEEGMLSLTSKESRKRNEKREEDYQRIIRTIPVVNYGSYKEDELGWDTPLEIFRDFTQKKIGKNDGVVPLESSFLNDTYQITEKGVDHLNSVTNTSGVRRVSILPALNYRKKWDYDRKPHFEALLESLRQISY